MNRREFLMASALVITSGKVLWDTCTKQYDKYLLHKIHYELPKHTHKSKNITKVDYEDKKNLVGLVGEGYGIIINGKYIQPAHMTHDGGRGWKRVPGGMINIQEEVKEKKVSLYGKELEIEVLDYEKDVGVFKLPNDLNIENFPCKPQKHRRLGEEIFVIGNPFLKGSNIRRGYISDLDDYDEKGNCFGINSDCYPGDSGSPVVNRNYKLLGLVTKIFGLGMSYVTKIEEYLK